MAGNLYELRWKQEGCRVSSEWAVLSRYWLLEVQRYGIVGGGLQLRHRLPSQSLPWNFQQQLKVDPANSCHWDDRPSWLGRLLQSSWRSDPFLLTLTNPVAPRPQIAFPYSQQRH